jgi:hypothetical protein
MVPDDLIKPQHLSIAVSELTPEERPPDLTDEVWDLIEECADQAPNLDAVEVHECLTTGACSDKIEEGHDLISLPMVLFVLAEQASPEASSSPDLRGRH